MSPEGKTPPTPLTPEEVAGTDTISSLALSWDGSRVVYCVGPHYRTGDHSTSALWIAETQIENSSRRITSGDKHDFAPSFHPVSADIYFLSDRREAGGAAKMYRLPVDATLDTEPTLLLELEGQSVASFAISPDGSLLAFTAKKDKRDKDPKAKKPIRIWRDKSDLASLYVIDLHGEQQKARALITTGAHVESFSWSPDSRSILYRLCNHGDQESLRGEPVRDTVVDVASGTVHDQCTYARKRSSPISIWRACGDIVFTQNTTPDIYFSAQSLWTRSLSGGDSRHLKYGETEDSERIVDLREGSQYVVAVAHGLDTRLDVLDAEHNTSTIYETHDDHFSDFDVRATGSGRYSFVVLRSSAVRGEPLEVWSGTTGASAEETMMRKLSAHNTWLSRDRIPASRAFHWTSPDGQEVQGVISHPRGAVLKNMPTVLVIHGGPTFRDVLDLSFQEWSWRAFLASQGYLVLSPNYRGSIGRGDKFVQAANGGMGTTDWMDVQSMVDQCIADGTADPARVAITGYSQGGFLTAWGVSRPNNTFKAGVDGAGVTDWGMLAASSDVPDLEAALGGGAPWTSVPENAPYLQGSPIRHCKYVRAPLLLLHGEQDSRVPLSQAVAFLRGVERSGNASVKLIIYPREDHNFAERVHAVDVLQRLADHIRSHLGLGEPAL